MTSDEARSKIDLCERKIKESFSEFRKDVENCGLMAEVEANRQKLEIERARKVMMLVSIIVAIIGFFLCGFTVEVGVVFLFGGIVVAYIVYKNKNMIQRIVDADNKLIRIKEQRSQLQATLSSQKTI